MSLKVSLFAIGVVSLSFLSLTTFASQAGEDQLKQTYNKNHPTTPASVLYMLRQGNERYMNKQPINYDQRAKSKQASKDGQAPDAFIFSCVDSRSMPEVIFNQPLGKMFVGRIAGNVLDKNAVGSIEFATQYAGTKLVVIMGHTGCGAVVGSCSNVNEPRNLKKLLKKIKPAIGEYKASHNGVVNCDDPKQIGEITKQNVLNQMKYLLKVSPATQKLVDSGQVKVVGAMHDLKTGQVTFFDGQGNIMK